MLGFMTATEVKWVGRVRDWRASGKTAEAFVLGQGFEASTLRYWASRLKAVVAAPTTPPELAGPKKVAMARVIRRRRSLPVAGRGAETAEIAIAIGAARITVSRGVDPELLRLVVAALGGGR
jgi:hypothetical protein